MGGGVGGDATGARVGTATGTSVGFGIGIGVGRDIGASVGLGLGASVGLGLGAGVGFGLGLAVGAGVLGQMLQLHVHASTNPFAKQPPLAAFQQVLQARQEGMGHFVEYEPIPHLVFFVLPV